MTARRRARGRWRPGLRGDRFRAHLRGRRPAAGQAAVELALALPLVALVLLSVVQVALVARDQVLVVHAAREAARKAAVDPRADLRRAAGLASGLDQGRLTISLAPPQQPDGMVVVSVGYQAATRVPLVGIALPDVALQAMAAMRAEYDFEW